MSTEPVLKFIHNKKDVILKRSAGTKCYTYPLKGFKGKPEITLGVYKGKKEDLKKIVFGELIKGTLDCDLFLRWLIDSSVNEVNKLESDWKSYNVTIGQKGKEIRWTDLIDIKDGSEIKLEKATEKPTKLSDIILAILGLSIYRVNSAQNPEHKTKLCDHIEGFLRDLGLDSSVSISDWVKTYSGWLKNKSYLKVVASIDMYFNKFSTSDNASVRIGTLGSRYKDMAAWVSLGYLIKITGQTGNDLLKWIWERPIAEQIVRLCEPGQEDDQDDSYFPYGHDMGFVPISPYSTSANPDLFIWIHFIGALLNKTRSRNARMMEDIPTSSILRNSLLFAFAISQYSSMVGQFTESGNTEDSRTPVGQSGTMPKTVKGDVWLKWIKAQGGTIPSTIITWYNKVQTELQGARTGTVAEAITGLIL
ncbi:nucleoprotein [Sena Madureira virus]|uniref:Nucleoprotein n=1 Tax=Sena Madureira virus TaxID=1272957 RepID=A0A0D3R1U0_9RHAB|nr:nucleoprotein [Sena Madureira virus]AJR28440.1 nucleoprotein [Sena Madureira virus]